MNSIAALTNQFFQHIYHSIQHLDHFSTETNLIAGGVDSVVIAGLGGSGVGGGIVSHALLPVMRVPVVVVRDYHLPVFVSARTLVICSSYSGNTEETLSCYDEAIEKKAIVAVITSGGFLREKAEKNRQWLFQVPGGIPPRTALGYTLPVYFYLFERLGLAGTCYEDFKKAVQEIERKAEEIEKKSVLLSHFLYQKIPVLYSTSHREGLLVRFRQQLNENAKVLCWHHVIPEMNHNEVVGWRKKNTLLGVVFVSSSHDHPKNLKRMELTRKIVEQYTPHIFEIKLEAMSPLEEVLYLIHLFDKTSCHLADLNQVDAEEIEVIHFLKKEIGEKKK